MVGPHGEGTGDRVIGRRRGDIATRSPRSISITRLRADRNLLERAREAARALGDVDGPLSDEVDAKFAETELAA